MRPLDIVTTNTGAVGVVRQGDEKSCFIYWFGEAENKSAWWVEGEKGLMVIDNLASFLTEIIRHPMSNDQRNPYKEGCIICDGE